MPRRLAALAVAVVLAVIGYAVFSAMHRDGGVHVATPPEGCTARVESRMVNLSTAQAHNASIIAAVATRRELPARAASIALATAYQESGLQNLDYGDSDSLGLFQQRPSQGWGTPRQVMDPYYATNAFYNALVRIPSYSTMDITSAAQLVQRSAYPTAYALHEQNARDLASALTGNSPAAFSCVVNRQHLARQSIDSDGLTARADAVRAAVAKAYGGLPTSGRGHGVQVRFTPWNDGSRIRAWALAQFLVANAARLHVRQVVVDHHAWTAGRSSQRGWQPYVRPPSRGQARLVRSLAPARGAVTVTVW